MTAKILKAIIDFLTIIFFSCIKMSKGSSARYYPKKKNQKESHEKYWNLSEEEKGNKATVWAEQYTEISLKMKNKSKLIAEKDTLKS